MFDVGKHLFLVDIDQNTAPYCFPEPGTPDLARLENNIAVGQNDRCPLLGEMLKDRQRTRVYPVGKLEIYQE